MEDPITYPPTLNAINYLAPRFQKIFLVTKFVRPNGWPFPPNVELKYPKTNNRTGITVKIKVHFYVLFCMWLSIRKSKVVVVYDPVSLLFYKYVRLFSKPHKLWYHNHDVFSEVPKQLLRKKAYYNERKLLNKVDLFSLPTKERLVFYEGCNPKKVCVIPNYPDSERMNQKSSLEKGDLLKVIYQGRISKNHGLEELLEAASRLPLRVTLIGPGSRDYITYLENRIEELNVRDQVQVLKPVTYDKLQTITSTHNVGWAVNIPKEVIYATGGYASNKIYEYAACGLPIIYYNSESYNKILDSKVWAFKTHLKLHELQKIFHSIEINYEELSSLAITDIKLNFNYKKAFCSVWPTLQKWTTLKSNKQRL